MVAQSISHLLVDKCDPRKCPVEISRAKRATCPLTRALSRQVREKDRQLVAQFWASSGASGEGMERGRNPRLDG